METARLIKSAETVANIAVLINAWHKECSKKVGLVFVNEISIIVMIITLLGNLTHWNDWSKEEEK